MWKNFIALILILTLVSSLIFSRICYGESHVEITDLIFNAQDFDKKIIKIKGEAIGEIIKNGKDCQINISDGKNIIEIYGKRKKAFIIETLGRYDKVGDKVEIIGNFNRICEEHNGDMDIHYNSISVIEKGRDAQHEVKKYKVYSSLTLFILTAAISFVTYRKIK
ncbi:hypothetical protein U732_687 [Clostridium argentinense CDC 2741]|uniref:Uncharacterized protein n=1 Tax=Clostridium argentinense CDC 2741 TaxID=1418104 RepID=A0A0C1QW53_9CLOT|nr:hypothetical protein [Clostridium argentinense]ARC84162.1 hypothetical protein RSJ17_06235 [Clostridium argentinense]KIE45227.1 hypothetical protein U732_687 [Clostridium argentinense CDC 2741]NFF38108.1 hypothetical protein [Clostridium argentinense]NFP51227.1 hypothetical protein [Clostridium argentinense]NFP73800.1 hypothetical protein [Clostridium argentinense]